MSHHTLTLDRHRSILDHLETHGSLKVGTFVRDSQVSAMTVWRDLRLLETRGLIKRVRGGAVAAHRQAEPEFRLKEGIRHLAKRRLAATAVARFVEPGDVIYMEGGTTVAEMLPYLVKVAGQITIITNSLPILSRAVSLGVPAKLECSGGCLSGISGNFLGPEAAAYFHSRRARTVFLSATAFHLPETLLTDPNPAEIAIKRAMLATAERCVMLLDAGKFTRTSEHEVMPFDAVEALITDHPPTPELRQCLERNNVEWVTPLRRLPNAVRRHPGKRE